MCHKMLSRKKRHPISAKKILLTVQKFSGQSLSSKDFCSDSIILLYMHITFVIVYSPVLSNQYMYIRILNLVSDLTCIWTLHRTLTCSGISSHCVLRPLIKCASCSVIAVFLMDTRTWMDMEATPSNWWMTRARLSTASSMSRSETAVF